jgi:hypothetical protein
MSFEVIVHESAAREIEGFRAFDQRRILDEIEQQLSHQPMLVTRRRKCLGPLALTFEHEPPIWQLRVDEFVSDFLRCRRRVAARACPSS